MQSLTSEQLDRLPKYAQSYILQLEKRLQDSRSETAAARSGPADSNVLIRHFQQEDQLLGRDVPVTFDLLQAHPGAGIGPTKTAVTAHHQGPFTLEIRATGADSGALHVIPSASNSIRVRVGSWA